MGGRSVSSAGLNQERAMDEERRVEETNLRCLDYGEL